MDINNPVDYIYLFIKHRYPMETTKFLKDFGAGAVAAAVSKTVIAPVERVKLILQLQASQETIEVNKRYKGMIDCFLRIPKEQGFRSFWRGNASNVWRSGFQESFGMAFKELFKNYCVNEEQRNTHYLRFLAGNLLAGGLSGWVTFSIIYPLDFSRTRLAVDMGKDPASREFRGLVDCFIKVAKKDGLFGLYRGFWPSMAYIFLYRSVYYGFFDSTKVLGSKTSSDVHFLKALLCGQISTSLAALISYPLDTVRRRLMMQSGKEKREYRNTMDCFKKIYRTEGGIAFFHGFFVNAIRGFGAALVLAIYNEISKLYNT